MGKAATIVAGVALVWAMGASGVALYAANEAGPTGPAGPAGPQGELGATGSQGTGFTEPQTYGNATLVQNYQRLVLAIWCGPNGATGVLGTVTTGEGTQLQVCSAK